MNGNAFMIPTGSIDPEAAAKFGMYLMTDDPSRAMAIQNASVPQLKSLVTDPALTTVAHFGTFLDIANHPKTWTDSDDLGLPRATGWPHHRPRRRPHRRRRPEEGARGARPRTVQARLDANGLISQT